MSSSFQKDPAEVLDYQYDFKAYTHGVTGAKTDYLETGETIASYTVTAATGITKESDSESDGAVTVWLSGGTAGTKYAVTCQIVTSAGRTAERTIHIDVRDR